MNRTNLIVGVGIILCAASVIWLEGRFQQSDLRKAKALVREYKVDHRDETFEAFIVRKHGGRKGEWDAEVKESCQGVVLVQWYLEGNPPTIYQWKVNMSTNEIFVVEDSPGGKRMLVEFKAPKQQLPDMDLPPPDESPQ